MTDPTQAFKALAEKSRAKGIKIVNKRSYRKLWKAIDIILRIITFGKANRFLKDFTTTIGNIIAFQENWDESKAGAVDYITLRHELKHVDQYKRLGFGNVWLGLVFFGIAYLFLPLPTCFAWFRYKFEREAYRESFRAARELGLKVKLTAYVDALTGPDYFWTWILRKQVSRWFYKNCI